MNVFAGIIIVAVYFADNIYFFAKSREAINMITNL